MQSGYLAVSCVAFVFGLLMFLGPNVIIGLSRMLDKTVGAVESKLLKKRGARYVLGLLLFLVSFGMFRLAYTMPMMQW